MTTSPVHFPLTTPGQRRLLFETWESTGSVTGACRKAHVGRGEPFTTGNLVSRVVATPPSKRLPIVPRSSPDVPQLKSKRKSLQYVKPTLSGESGV